jgi:hypothetical protein
MFGIAGVVSSIKKSPEDMNRLYRGLISPFLKDGLSVRQMYTTKSCIISVIEPKLACVRSSFFGQFDDGVSVIVFGEIFDDRQPDESVVEYVHRLFIKDGISSFATLNGSFCLFIHNEAECESFLVADRFSSRPVLYHIGQEYTMFSPDQRSFVYSERVSKKVNLGAVAAMLSSGHLYHDDTYMQDVRYLRGGSALHVHPAEKQIIKYWDYVIEPQPDEGMRVYQSRLSPLLLQSVERRLKGESKPVLFLSGGVDSRTLLGACMELGFKVELCSYYSRRHRESDAYVVEKIAKLSGMPLHLIRYDLPDIMACVHETTPFFGGMRSSIYEYEALKKIQGSFSSILIGDEVFGWYECAMASEEDMFANMFVNRLSSNPWRRLLSSSHYEDIRTHDEASFNKLSSQTSLVNLLDRRGYFGATELLSRDIIPGRCFLNYCIAKVRQPWLDNDILDFMRLLPTQYRISKALFQSTVSSMFPHLFSTPKATNAGSYLDTSMYYPLILEKNPNVVKEACFQGRYSIDSIFAPDALEHYLRNPNRPLSIRIKEQIRNSGFPAFERVSKLIYDMVKQHSAIFARKMCHSNRLLQWQILERIAILRFMVGSQLALELE